jgi:hypothetical protein
MSFVRSPRAKEVRTIMSKSIVGFTVTDQDGNPHEVITDPAEVARIEERLAKARAANAIRMVVGERLKQSDVAYHCMCCTPSRPVLATLDPQGEEQYTCLATKITMRKMRCRPLPFTDPVTGRVEYRDTSTYVAGHLRLPG